MAIDLAALKAAKEQLESNGGSDRYLGTKDLTSEGTILRLLPPPPVLNGLFYLTVIKYWMTVNGKRLPIIDCATFGKNSVIEAELEEARCSDDPDVVAIATDTDNKTGMIRQEEHWMAALVLKYKTDPKTGEIQKVIVVDDTAKVFQCGKPTLTTQILNIVTQGPAVRRAKGAEDGMLDRVNGSNIVVSKTGQKLQTKYAAVLDEQMEMPEKWYQDIPNVYEIAKSQMKLPSYQRALIRQVLYGEAIPDEVEKKEQARAEKAKAEFQEHKKAAAEEAKAPKKKPAVSDDDDEAPAPKPKKQAVVSDDDDEGIPTPKKPKKAVVDDDDEDVPAPKKPAKKVAADDDDDDADIQPAKKPKKVAATEDDDDDPVPVPKGGKTPTVTKPSKSIIDDDDEDAPAPVTVKKTPPPPPAKKPANAKPTRSILDDLDEDDMPF
jgi:hypothetical protein